MTSVGKSSNLSLLKVDLDLLPFCIDETRASDGNLILLMRSDYDCLYFDNLSALIPGSFCAFFWFSNCSSNINLLEIESNSTDWNLLIKIWIGCSASPISSLMTLQTSASSGLTFWDNNAPNYHISSTFFSSYFVASGLTGLFNNKVRDVRCDNFSSSSISRSSTETIGGAVRNLAAS